VTADDRPALSVVVMGYRDGPTIVRAVASVVEQAGSDVEVVVVTSGGDDSAARVRAAYPGVVVIESAARLLPGAARNVGIDATVGRVVAFLEGDCVAEPGWVAQRRRRHDEGHAIVASAVTNGEAQRLAAWGFHFGVFGHRQSGRAAGEIAATDPGAHGCSFDRTVLEQVGGFPPDVRIGEDTITAHRLAARGLRAWYEPAVRTRHWGPRTTRGLLQDRFRRGGRRASVRGPVAPTWTGVLGHWARASRGSLPRYGRDAGSDRRWFLCSLPWIAAGDAAALIGQQRAARRAGGAQ
jgi:GT2 family glycosyltransferase